MSDAQQPSNQNGQKNGPSLSVGAQYIKDLSFENDSFLENVKNPPKKPPQTDVRFEVNAKHLEEDKFEVTLKTTARILVEEKPLYLLEVTYAGLFMISGLDEKTREGVLMVECPRILFPFVRQIVTGLTQDSGLPPLYLAPSVDFAALWQQQSKPNA